MCTLICLAIIYNPWPKKDIAIFFSPTCSSLVLGTTSPKEQDDIEIIQLMRKSGHTAICFKGSLLSLWFHTFKFLCTSRELKNRKIHLAGLSYKLNPWLNLGNYISRLFPFKHFKYIWVSFLIMILAIYRMAKWTLRNTIKRLADK